MASQTGRHALVLATCSACLAATPATAGFTYQPGHTYTPVNGGQILEWDEDLDQVGSIAVANVTTTTGVTFGPNGNLVFIGRRTDTQSVHVMEVDATGSIVRDFDTGQFALLSGSYIDYDPVSGRYAFAESDRITILDRDLNPIGSTSGYEFTRASGVAWGPMGTLFATDQIGNRLVEFDASLTYSQTLLFGVDNGMDLSGDDLYVTYVTTGRLFRYDIATGDSSLLVGPLGFGALSDVLVRPDGNLLTTSTTNDLSVYSPRGTLLDFSAGDVFGNGIAYLVPGPGGVVFLVGLLVLGGRGRGAEES